MQGLDQLGFGSFCGNGCFGFLNRVLCVLQMGNWWFRGENNTAMKLVFKDAGVGVRSWVTNQTTKEKRLCHRG